MSRKSRINAGKHPLDADLQSMSREELIAEAKKLREGIREHRDADLHELCWHHPRLWGLLPERSDPLPKVPAWPQFMEGCVRYRASLDAQAGKSPRSKAAYRPDDEAGRSRA